MRNLKVRCCYDGSGFYGFQLQPHHRTVAGELNRALSELFCEEVKVIGCSRTDSGVHAKEFLFSVRTNSAVPCENIVRAMSTMLTPEIGIYDCMEMPSDFHPRIDCKRKTYSYRIWNSRQPNPFLRGRALFYPFPLDEEALNKAAAEFLGEHDFSAFMSSGSQIKTRVRTVLESSVHREDREVVFTVCATGFLYNMVRIMVGTLLEIAEGKISLSDISGIIKSKDRHTAGRTAPAEGLYLERVYYD